MKILHVITSLRIGGAEKLIVDIVPLQQKRGHQVEVALLDGVDTSFKEFLVNLGVKIHDLEVGKSLFKLSYIFKLRKLAKEFDIIHTHNFHPQYYAVLSSLCGGGNAKLVTTEHSTHNRRRDIAFFKPIERFIYKKYSSIICISKRTEVNLVNFIKSSNGVVTISNGINLSLIDGALPCEKTYIFGVDSNIKIITQVAGFRIEKDQDTLIRTLALLPDNIHVVFVGDGVRRPTCEALAEEVNVSDRVHFLGLRSDVPQVLKSSDIVVMSSHWEGFGLAAVEGMAAQKPVIASNVDGLAQVVGGAGILFEKGNQEELASYINRLINDEDYYNEVSVKCKERAELYDINNMVSSYEQEYYRVLN